MSKRLAQVAPSPLEKAPAWLKLGLGLALGILLTGLSHAMVAPTATLIWLILQGLARQNPWRTIRACFPALPLVATVGILNSLEKDWPSGLFLAWRLCLLLWVAHLMVACTPYRETVGLLERILRPLPLRWLGLSSRDLALMLLLSIRFLPLLQQEIKGLLKAQRARAFSPRRISWKARMKYLLLLGPLLLERVSRRADHVSRALRARAYVPGGLSGSSGSEAM